MKRERGVLSEPVAVSYQGFCSGVWHPVSWYTKIDNYVEGRYECIIDEEPQFKRFGNCYHRKRRVSYLAEPGKYRRLGVDCGGDNMHEFSSPRGFVAFYFPTIPGVPVPPVPEWDSFANRAYMEMKPSLDSGFSLSNFLAELREIKTLFKLLDRRKSLLQNAAAGHLNWSFGWKPTISDVKELFAKLLNFDKALSDYMSQQGRPLVRHYSEVISSEVDEVVNNYQSPHAIRVIHSNRTVYTATMKYVYTIPSIGDARMRLRALLDYYGLKVTPSVIWNGVMFSFVWDWFFNVGQFLSQLDFDHLESKVTILDFCVSQKFLMDAVVHIQPFGSVNPMEPMLQITEALYERKRMLPSGEIFGIIANDKYGTKQIVLSAALILA